MTRVLSLLLLIPFLVTQVWAGSGGPYEGPYGNSQAAWSGTYGISLQGSDAAGVDAISTTGVLALSVPLSGMTMGRILIFDKGLMYIGSSQGRLDPRNGKLKLLAQASHYTVLSNSTTTVGLVVDYILGGQLNLNMTADYFSGLIVVSGDATFARYDPIAESLTTNRTTTTNSQSTKVNMSGTADDGTPVGTVTTSKTTASDNTKTDVVSVIDNADGSVTTVTKSTTQTSDGPDTNLTKSTGSNEAVTLINTVQSTDPNELHRNTPISGASTVQGSDMVTVESTSALRPGMTVSGPGIANGTTVIRVVGGDKIQLSKPATVTASGVTLAGNNSSIIFLTMTADGLREDVTPMPLPVMVSPTQATFYQIGVTAGGANGAAGAGGATGGAAPAAGG